MAASIDRWKQTADRLLIEPWRGMFCDFLAEHRAAGSGFAAANPEVKAMRLLVPDLSKRSIALKVDDHIVCFGPQVHDASWEALAFGDDTLIVHRSCWRPEEPFHLLHLFAGAYSGWSRAVHWLAKTLDQVEVATELFIDNDPKIMGVWSCQTGMRHHHGKMTSKTPIDLASKAGGRKLGLNCCEGFAMAETAKIVEIQQPLLIFLEGADTTISHDHFPLVECMLSIIGYRKVWDQVVSQHTLSNNQRTRWLAVWARADLDIAPHGTKFDLRAPPLVMWRDPLNEFWTPESFSDQLQLDADALQKYGNPGLLPPAKRARSSSDLNPAETIKHRLADTHQALPTLCSSYTRQHLLHVDHIMSKGIFASLQIVNDKVCFLCPTRFVPLFGTTDKIVLPSDASFAFHILGNAISQSQATLCLAVGLQSLFAVDFAPAHLVRQAWDQRLTSQTALVQVFDQWLTVMKVEDIAATMLPRTLPMSFDGPMLSLELEHVQRVLTNAAAAWQQPVLHQAALFAMRLLPCFKFFRAAFQMTKHQEEVEKPRHNRHPSSSRDDDQLQVIAKLPSAARCKLLSGSGLQGILIRDFLDQGAQPLDTSVIPKFWEISLKGLRELSISIEGVKGAAGAILTRRGLAVRAWSSEIAEVRRKLLPMDARLNDTNIKVVPRFLVDASGWPPGASPTDVIETVAKAVSQAPIPTRTFRAAGVHTWQFNFQTMPTVLTFTVKINGALHQILLTPTPPTTKGGGKGKNRNPKKTATKEDEPFPPAVTSIAAVAAQHDKKRLDHLENKFETLQKQVCGIEHKQTNLESKLDQRFNDIGDTLRQLVQLSTNRAHEPTGESPPPKTQRTL
ncbi:Uncharacterized protein SCF082_LOCUS44343 [Durusdinium trenchii]|uniref:Uncharacterized protein n=1 Tax=Durusdinium trenchii TaxID=1381693 RepID=A0ABP0R3E8_9DINO